MINRKGLHERVGCFQLPTLHLKCLCRISCQELVRDIHSCANPPLLIDVRPRREFELVHLAGMLCTAVEGWLRPVTVAPFTYGPREKKAI